MLPRALGKGGVAQPPAIVDEVGVVSAHLVGVRIRVTVRARVRVRVGVGVRVRVRVRDRVRVSYTVTLSLIQVHGLPAMHRRLRVQGALQDISLSAPS